MPCQSIVKFDATMEGVMSVTVIQSYHEYSETCVPVVVQSVHFHQKEGNPYNSYAVVLVVWLSWLYWQLRCWKQVPPLIADYWAVLILTPHTASICRVLLPQSRMLNKPHDDNIFGHSHKATKYNICLHKTSNKSKPKVKT